MSAQMLLMITVLIQCHVVILTAVLIVLPWIFCTFFNEHDMQCLVSDLHAGEGETFLSSKFMSFHVFFIQKI